METSIQTYIDTGSGLKKVTLFGYTSKGLPGVEIHGIPSKGKLIKEKMIYLTRALGLKVPLLRYCLCIDTKFIFDKSRRHQYFELEIPFLLMFWHLAGLLPIHKLDDCIVSGHFDIKGALYFYKTIDNQEYTTIGVGEELEASGLLEHIPSLSFQRLDREYIKE